MSPFFELVQMIGSDFDVEHETMKATPTTEAGVMLFFSALGLLPTASQIRQWCALARIADGAPIDCMVWVGDDPIRRPIGCVRMRYRRYPTNL